MFPNSVPLVMQEARYNAGKWKRRYGGKWTVDRAAEKELAFRLNPVFGRQNCDDILIMFVELILERNLSQLLGRCKGISYGPASLTGQSLLIFDVWR